MDPNREFRCTGRVGLILCLLIVIVAVIYSYIGAFDEKQHIQENSKKFYKIYINNVQYLMVIQCDSTQICNQINAKYDKIESRCINQATYS